MVANIHNYFDTANILSLFFNKYFRFYSKSRLCHVRAHTNMCRFCYKLTYRNNFVLELS
jgi:hypothetical protein